MGTQHLWGSSRSWAPTRAPHIPRDGCCGFPKPGCPHWGYGGCGGERSQFGELWGLGLWLSISPCHPGR